MILLRIACFCIGNSMSPQKWSRTCEVDSHKKSTLEFRCWGFSCATLCCSFVKRWVVMVKNKRIVYRTVSAIYCGYCLQTKKWWSASVLKTACTCGPPDWKAVRSLSGKTNLGPLYQWPTPTGTTASPIITVAMRAVSIYGLSIITAGMTNSAC